VDEVRLLERVFEKRHVHEHDGGIVSPRYVEQIPGVAALLGQRAPCRSRSWRRVSSG